MRGNGNWSSAHAGKVRSPLYDQSGAHPSAKNAEEWGTPGAGGAGICTCGKSREPIARSEWGPPLRKKRGGMGHPRRWWCRRLHKREKSGAHCTIRVGPTPPQKTRRNGAPPGAGGAGVCTRGKSQKPIVRSEWGPPLRKRRGGMGHPRTPDYWPRYYPGTQLWLGKKCDNRIGGRDSRIYVTLRSKIADHLTQHVTQPKGLPVALTW